MKKQIPVNLVTKVKIFARCATAGTEMARSMQSIYSSLIWHSNCPCTSRRGSKERNPLFEVPTLRAELVVLFSRRRFFRDVRRQWRFAVSTSVSRIPSLDGLRAVSIFLVLIAHFACSAGFPIQHNWWTDVYAHYGVRIFSSCPVF